MDSVGSLHVWVCAFRDALVVVTNPRLLFENGTDVNKTRGITARTHTLTYCAL